MKRFIQSAALALTIWFPFEARGTDHAPTSRHEVYDSSSISLEDFLVEVERHWPRLQAAELEKRVADGELLSAEGGFDVSWKTKGTVRPVGYYEAVLVESLLEKPTSLWGASTFAGWRLGSGEFAVYDGKQQTLDYGELLAGVSVPLWKDGPIDERRAKLQRAELGRKLATLTVQEQRIALRKAATHAYWEWIAAGRYLAIAERLLSNVQERDKALVERVSQGVLAPIELADNARAVAQRENQLTNGRRLLTQAELKLSLFLQGSKLSSPGIPGRFPEPQAHQTVTANIVKEAQAARPEIDQLDLKLKQNQIEARWAKNQTAPGIDIRVLGSQDFGPANAARPDLNDPVLEVSVLIDIPLQRRLMKGRLMSTNARAAQLRLEQTLTHNKISVEVLSAEAGITAALEGIQAARREIALTIELEKSERTRFEDGASHLLFVNLREQQTAEAELREISALLDYHRAAADLLAARGQ